MAKNDPKKDGKAIDKLQRTKRVNKVERDANRSDGKDGKHTRDGGTNRRNWR